MKYRMLGKTKWPVSELGYGCWGLGKKWWGATEDAESLRALKTAWESGVNFFDTAYVYGDGHSERLLAKALKGTKAFVATKIPPKNNMWPPDSKTPFRDVFPEDWIASCTKRSLKNLQTDVLDLTQFHVWSDAWLDEGAGEAIQALKASGTIRSFGVSINNHDPGSAVKLVASGLVDTVQVIFNIFDQSPKETLFPLCLKHNVGVIARVPFDEGGLTGTLTEFTTFEKGDFRGQYFRDDHLKQTVQRVQSLKTFLDENTPDMPSLALKYVLGHGAVSTVIPGMRTVSHVRHNVGVMNQMPLDVARVKDLSGHAWPRNFYTWWK